MSTRRALAPLSLLLAACANRPAPIPDAAVARDVAADLPGDAPGPYPSASELPERPALPSLDESFDGTRRVNSRDDWESWRRAELRDLFAHYIYGHAPPPVVVRARTITSVDAPFPSVARYTEVELTLGDGPVRLHLALFLPVGVSRPRVFLALNKCGNQEALPDPRVRWGRIAAWAWGRASRDPPQTVARAFEAWRARNAAHA